MKEARGDRGRNRRVRKKGRPGKRPPREELSQRGPGRRRGAGHKSRGVLDKAIAHPLRRRMLYAIDKENAPLSPAQLAKAFDLPLGFIAYHAAVLRRCGAVEVTPDEDV